MFFIEYRAAARKPRDGETAPDLHGAFIAECHVLRRVYDVVKYGGLHQCISA